MRPMIDANAERMLSALGHLVGAPLEWTATSSDDAATVACPFTAPSQLAIRRTDGREFSDAERPLLREIIAFVALQASTHSEVQALEQRLRLLERENVGLILKNRALAEIASRDPLTGVYTRWYLLDKMEAELGRALRHGSPVAVLLADIDRFHEVNEAYGVETGDRVLQAVGKVLKESCRVYDVPGRYGGEEFALVLPETKISQTLPVADRIRRSLETAAVQLGSSLLTVTVSIGIAGVEKMPEDGVFSASSLIERAARALETAKDEGRNRAEIWSASMAVGRAVEH
jgi:diguanylate cyclase